MKMRLLSRCVCGLVMFALGSPLLLPGADEVVEGDHKIAPLDIINIDVVGEKDLTKELRVSSSGTITFPFLGSIEVKGKTPAEVEDWSAVPNYVTTRALREGRILYEKQS